MNYFPQPYPLFLAALPAGEATPTVFRVVGWARSEARTDRTALDPIAVPVGSGTGDPAATGRTVEMLCRLGTRWVYRDTVDEAIEAVTALAYLHGSDG